MERNLYDEDELEDFLKRKANQYKIYPSDKVWNGIYTSLHAGRKWHIIGGSLLLLSILTLIGLEKTIPDQKNSVVKKNIITNVSYTTNTIEENKTTTQKKIHSIITASITGKKISPVKLTNVSTHTALSEKTDIDKSFIPGPSPEISLVQAIAETGNNKNVNSLSIPEIPQHEKTVNWLEEKAIVRLSPEQRKHVKVQFYLSPTISYRSLQGDNSTRTTIGNRGIKGLVNQAPALGLELGTALQLNITRNFMLKTGMQFNYVRYNINAYRSSPERTSITLSGAGYYNSSTITTYSTLRNFSGGYPETIQNQYLQLSMPVGVEWRIAGNKRLQLNVAGSIQPAYLLANNAYMLSSDLSNYTKEPSLVRRWNVNAGIETFVSYQSGSLRWQVGPQFRYQMLSSYTDRYPIREYLKEYGMKIGVSKIIK